jgi:hypothetical protein
MFSYPLYGIGMAGASKIKEKVEKFLSLPLRPVHNPAKRRLYGEGIEYEPRPFIDGYRKHLYSKIDGCVDQSKNYGLL